MPSPTPDERLAEQADLTEQIFRECKTALADLDNEQTAGKPGKENVMDPIVAWEKKIEEYKQRGLTEAKAIRETAVNHPEIHRNYLVAFNAQHGRVL